MINRGLQPLQNNGIMKHLLLTIAIALAAFSATARDLAVFNLNSFDGWIFNLPNAIPFSLKKTDDLPCAVGEIW